VQERKASAIALSAPPVSSSGPVQGSPIKVTPSISQLDINSTKFAEKVLLTAWHPKEAIVAVSGMNRLDVYQKKPIRP